MGQGLKKSNMYRPGCFLIKKTSFDTYTNKCNLQISIQKQTMFREIHINKKPQVNESGPMIG